VIIIPILDQTDLDNVADAVWDEILTGLSHNIQNSAGKRLRDIAAQALHTGTSQGPAVNGNQIQLSLDAADFDGAYDPAKIAIIDGMGAGQTRLIYEYAGSTRIATIDRDWKVEPDNTSEYIIFADAGREHVNEGLARGGTSNTITLNALASDDDNAYRYQSVFLRSGTGQDQVGHISSYDGTTKIATLGLDWVVIPDTTTGYAVLPTHINPEGIATHVWAAADTNVTAGSMGALLKRVLGLTQENQFIDTTTHDSKGNMLTGRLRIYSVAGSVGTDNDVTATYTITATYIGTNLATYKMVKS
jgi:hypothetical protein